MVYTFQDLMKSLWKVMQIDLPSDSTSEVYSIMFANQVEIHLLNTVDGMIDIIAEAGTLRDPLAGPALLQLLALNHPPLTVSIDKDSGIVMVWVRQGMAYIEMERLTSLISDLVNTVSLARQCIDGKQLQELFGPAARHDIMYVPSNRETTLTQLRRRN
jgi:hypothetical protein